MSRSLRTKVSWCALCATFIPGCVLLEYRQAKSANTVAEYEKFLATYPNGSSAKETRVKLAALKAQIASARNDSDPMKTGEWVSIGALGGMVEADVEVTVQSSWKLAFKVPRGGTIHFFKGASCASCGGEIAAFQRVRACITCAQIIRLPRDFVLPIGNTSAIITGPEGAIVKRKAGQREIALVAGQAWTFEADNLPPDFAFRYSEVSPERLAIRCKSEVQMTMAYADSLLNTLTADSSDCSVEEL